MHLFFTGLLRPVFYFPLALLFALLSLKAVAQSDPSSALPLVSLQINQSLIQAEVADTESTRAQGLMHRTALAPNRGMLFVFEQTMPMCFWMKNTPLPLSIAFITEDGTISNIEAMQPFDTTSVCPIVPIKYALEMEQGWFAKEQINAGDVVKSLPN